MFFINKRYIKDKTLSAGAEQAFKGLLPIGKYGFLVLNLDIDPSKIDVNVHPTKLEIRFQEEQKVFKAVYHSIREALLKGDLVKNPEKEIEETAKIQLPVQNISQETVQMPSVAIKEKEEKIETPIEEKNLKEENIQEEEKKKSKPLGLFGLLKKKNVEEEIENNAIQEIYSAKNIEEQKEDLKNPYLQEDKADYISEIVASRNVKTEFNKMYSETFGISKKEKEDEVEKINDYELSDSTTLANAKNVSMFDDSEEEIAIPPYKYCGTVFSTYIIIEMGKEMYMIDQHAAHERILYEEIKKNFYSNMEKESQIMLLPDIINLSHKEKQIVRENTDLFKKAGFLVEEFGDNTIRLIGVPAICMDLNTKELFLEILDTIDTVAITAKQEKEDKFIATVACKAAVKANMNLNKEEVDKLMQKLLVLPNPFTCPHGRPTAIKMEKEDLEKKFNRRK